MANDRVTDKTVKMVDKQLKIIHKFDPEYKLKQNKFYIGLERNRIANNFVCCKPKKQWVNTECTLQEDEELIEELTNADLEFEYFSKWGLYGLRLRPGDVEQNEELLEKFFKLAYDASQA